MDIQLNEIEVRVLGALIEKETTTPDYYPLSLNALVNACNQKSNREPAMNLDQSVVRDALDSLNAKGLAGPLSSAESRVTKYAHRLQEVFNFDRRETAVLCMLFLRGPQTPGELRVRTERMYAFDDLAVVESTLRRLMEREPPLVKKLPRVPGTKESRYAHLLAGDVETWDAGLESSSTIGTAGPDDERVARLEDDVAALQKELADLRQQFVDFRKQFE
jgi:uncharacterized protein YceH (UPF0502 family)